MGSTDQVTIPSVVLFDGVCNLCNGWVKFIISRDNKRQFGFAALQSEYARKQLTQFGNDPSRIYSIILIHQNTLLHKSDAVLEIFFLLGGFWKLFYVFKILPTFLEIGYMMLSHITAMEFLASRSLA